LVQSQLKRSGFEMEQNITNPKHALGALLIGLNIESKRFAHLFHNFAGIKGAKFGFNLTFEAFWFRSKAKYLKSETCVRSADN